MTLEEARCVADNEYAPRGRSTLSRDAYFFFFQAEDGIRDLTVTGVQTCALPISAHLDEFRRRLPGRGRGGTRRGGLGTGPGRGCPGRRAGGRRTPGTPGDQRQQIGRASCRERV